MLADAGQKKSVTDSASNDHLVHAPQSPSPSSNKTEQGLRQGTQSTAHDSIYPSSKTRLYSNGRPTMKELTTLSTPNGRINIIREVTPIWNEVGRHLDFDNEGTRLKIIEGSQSNLEICCADMFQHWLYGNGVPCSWKVLVRILQECGRKHLAEMIKSCY